LAWASLGSLPALQMGQGRAAFQHSENSCAACGEFRKIQAQFARWNCQLVQCRQCGVRLVRGDPSLSALGLAKGDAGQSGQFVECEDAFGPVAADELPGQSFD